MHNLQSTLGCYDKSSVGQWVKINLFIFSSNQTWKWSAINFNIDKNCFLINIGLVQQYVTLNSIKKYMRYKKPNIVSFNIILIAQQKIQ